MNNLQIGSIPIWIRITLTSILLVIVSSLWVFVTSLTGAQQIGEQNIQAYIAESGERQAQAVRNEFSNLLRINNDFVNNAVIQGNIRGILLSHDVISLQARNRELIVAFPPVVRNQLFRNDENSIMDGAWITYPTGEALVTVAPIGDLVEDMMTTGASDAFIAGSEEPPRVRTLNINFPDDSLPYAVLYNPIYDISGLRLVGYFTLRINLNNLVAAQLSLGTSQLPRYSFALLANDYVLQPPGAQITNRISLDSLAVARAREGLTGTEIYGVGIGDNRREVIGHFTTFNLLNEQIGLFTEIDRSVTINQIGLRVTEISLPTLVGLGFFTLLVSFLLIQTFTPAIQQITVVLRGMLRGQNDLPLPSSSRGDELGALASTVTELREQSQRLVQDLTRRIDERTRDVRITQEISRAATAQSDLQSLMNEVVNLIQERFNSIYHAQIFLLDQDGDYAILRASTGEAGRKLLERGHRLQVGSVSVIGQVTQQGSVVIARDTGMSDVHRRNEFLPDTRAELAIPLQIGDRIIGALDVQSKQSESFDEDQVNTLQTLADQITIAIENTRLYESSQRILREIELAQQRTTRHVWQDYLYLQRATEITAQAGVDTGYDFTTLRQEAINEKAMAVGSLTERDTIPIALPLQIRDFVVGTIQWEMPRANFSQDGLLLAQAVANRLSTSLENARLFYESRRSTERERIVNEIAARITEQSDIQQILKTAVKEVGQALQMPQVAIRLQLANGDTVALSETKQDESGS